MVSDTTVPSSPGISINSGADNTSSTGVTLTLSATDDFGVTGYYTSESSITPSNNDSGWSIVTSTTSFSATDNFTISRTASAGNASHWVYVWFKDAAGNVSDRSVDVITYLTWTKQLGTSSDDYARGVATDSSGNVYVTGYTSGGLDGNTSAGNSDLFVVKYNSSGTKQ